MSGIKAPQGNSTTIWPSDFGLELTSTGYQMIGVADQSIPTKPENKALLRIKNYLCGNPAMSASNTLNWQKALAFWGAVRWVKIPENNLTPQKMTTPEKLASPDYDLLAKGQGYPIDVCTILEHIWANRSTFAKVIPKYVNVASFQDLVDKLNSENILGLDCLGFVHQYLSRAEIVSGYAGFKALQYLAYFKPITSLNEIAGGCICVWSNDSHIVIVDEVMSDISGGKRIAICQSSGSIKYGLVDVKPSGNFGDDGSPSAGKAPLNALGVQLNKPRTFDLSNGDVPRLPNVVIGKLRGFVLT